MRAILFAVASLVATVSFAQRPLLYRLPQRQQQPQQIRESLVNVEQVIVPIRVNGPMFGSFLPQRVPMRMGNTNGIMYRPGILSRLFGHRNYYVMEQQR